jgi:hypothetical protein
MRIRLATLAPLAVLLASSPALAFDFGVGLEGVGSASVTSSGAVTSGGGGLIFEERFGIPLVDLTLWEDVQTPLLIQRTGGDPSSYVPANLGFRVGLGAPFIKPYIGVLLNDSFLTSAGTLSEETSGLNLHSNVPGVGGDIGADISVLIFRFGLEVRGYTTFSPIESSVTSFSPFVLQGLISARFSF